MPRFRLLRVRRNRRRPPRSASLRELWRWIIFNKRLESRQRRVPVTGDLVEREACVIEGSWAKLEKALAAAANAANQAGAAQDAEVLGDRLSGERRAGGEPGD